MRIGHPVEYGLVGRGGEPRRAAELELLSHGVTVFSAAIDDAKPPASTWHPSALNLGRGWRDQSGHCATGYFDHVETDCGRSGVWPGGADGLAGTRYRVPC